MHLNKVCLLETADKISADVKRRAGPSAAADLLVLISPRWSNDSPFVP